RRQSHDDSIDIIALEQLLGLQEQAVLLAGKAFGPGDIGVRDGMKRAQRFERADVIGAPIAASEDCDTRFHMLLYRQIRSPRHSRVVALTQPPATTERSTPRPERMLTDRCQQGWRILASYSGRKIQC